MVKKKRPLLSKKHRQERLDFALSHQDWTVDDWRRVVWSDETKINCLRSDGQKWVWKKAGEGLSDRLVEGTKKFGGGSVMGWGCMMWEVVGYACRIDGRMDGDLYIKILDEEFQESIKFYHKTKDDIIFQQDNDPKHTCKTPPPGSKTIIMKSYHGLHSLQILMLLNICGVTSRKGWQIMRFHLEEFWSYRAEYRWNRTR